jgi:hypothetical protein
VYDVVEREYIAEKKAAAKEFEEKKIELRENLLNDFEDKRKMIENERHSMELNGDSTEVSCCSGTCNAFRVPRNNVRICILGKSDVDNDYLDFRYFVLRRDSDVTFC